MPDQLKFITARRSYEFRVDDLRLTLICTQPVQQTIQQAFSFLKWEIGTPLAMVEPVPGTLPPGIVFNFGHVALHEGEPTPIRFLHFEPSRMVIDVAGKSEAIDRIYEIVRQLLSTLRAPDGSPAMGEPERVIDYSEFTFHSDGSLASFLAPDLAGILHDTAVRLGAAQETVVVPMIRVAVQAPNREYTGTSSLSPDHTMFALELRAGTSPEEGAVFSAASLPTADHLAYLASLDNAFPTFRNTREEALTLSDSGDQAR